MLRLENVPKGAWVWANHPSDVWQPARIIERHNHHLKVCYFNDSEGIVQNQDSFCQIPSIQCFKDDLDNLEIYNDLSAMSTLSTPSVLYFLHKAYSSGIYYSKIGSGTVLAINPFQNVNELFSDEIINKYNSATLTELSALPAHIFGIAEAAFRGMQGQMGGSNQSIIISGESGAGKTWTVRCLMRYFATVGASLNLSESIVGNEIEHRVLCSNPILEAFGNASTPRNHNSSRFGKYIQLQYNRLGYLVGACLQVYLLEKTRVASQGGSEQAYHIFYQMLNGASDQERREWHLPTTCSIRKTNGNANNNNIRNTHELDMDDNSAFEQTRESLLSVGISNETQNSIFKFLSAILHLVDIEFEGTDDLSTPCIIISQNDNIKHASTLLEVPTNKLIQAITIREIEAGRRKSVFKRSCTRAECAARRDALVKSLYENIFLWLVENIGIDLSADRESIHSFIGLLDVYGFESFTNNGLEQLCINYANEKLQQYYVTNFLKAQQEELVAEGVTWEGLSLDQLTNTCLFALESPRQSVFALFNEECRLNRGSTPNQLKDRLTEQFGKSKYITQPRILTKVPSFSVAHYAGPVVYRIENLIPNNKDEVPVEIVALFLSSSNPFCVELFKKHEMMQCNAQRGKQHETVLIQFKKSLDNLLTTLSSTKCHYIRCIKPNKKSLPLLFDAFHVVDQLRSCGIVETISICGKLYPHQISFKNFVSHFGFLLQKQNPTNGIQLLSMDQCRNILNSISTKFTGVQQSWQMGKSKVFISASLFEFLEAERNAKSERSSKIIQKTWRNYSQRKICRENRKILIQRRINAAGVLQNRWRYVINVRRCCKLVQLKKLNRNRAAKVIQKSWKNFVQSNADAKLLITALTINNIKLQHAVIHTKIPQTVQNTIKYSSAVTDTIFNIEISKQNHLSLSLLVSMIDPFRLATYYIKPLHIIRCAGCKPYFLNFNPCLVLTSKYSKLYFVKKKSEKLKSVILPYAYVKPRNGALAF